MRLRDKKIEELLDMVEDLYLAKEAEKDGALYRQISVYEELYKKISSNQDSEYTFSMVHI